MRTYDINFKQKAIKLAKEIGSTKAAKELNIPSGTMDTWISKAKTGKLTGKAPTPKNAMTLDVSRQGYNKYLKSQGRPHKHAALLAAIKAILQENEYNDTYGRELLHDSLLRHGFHVSLSTLYRVCRKHGILAKRNYPKGLTKAEKEAYKNDDLLHGDFHADEPNQKLITDITQLPAKDGILYISGVFDCYNNQCVGLSIAEHMRTSLVIESFTMAIGTYPVYGAFCHSDRGGQYTSHEFREYAQAAGFVQSMSFAGSSCYGNAKCESM